MRVKDVVNVYSVNASKMSGAYKIYRILENVCFCMLYDFISKQCVKRERFDDLCTLNVIIVTQTGIQRIYGIKCYVIISIFRLRVTRG